MKSRLPMGVIPLRLGVIVQELTRFLRPYLQTVFPRQRHSPPDQPPVIRLNISSHLHSLLSSHARQLLLLILTSDVGKGA